MNRNILLSDAYQDRRDDVERIVAAFAHEGETVHAGRNVIKRFATATGFWNVKRYHRPSLLNRVVYTLFRQSKGLRAFTYPNRVLSAGFETPYPVAYVEERSCGLIDYSYFISEECPYQRDFYELGDASVDDCRDLLTDFVHFTAGLHEAGIYHRDYSPGNILFDRMQDGWHFSIVDINRMEFGPVSIQKGCRNFARLWGQPEMFRFIGSEYAHARGGNEKQCTKWVVEARNKFWRPRAKHFHLPYKLRF